MLGSSPRAHTAAGCSGRDGRAQRAPASAQLTQSSFSEKRQFHLEASNLLKAFGFAGGLGLLITGPLLPKQGAPLLQELLLPLGNLGRMHLTYSLASWLSVCCSLSAARATRNLKSALRRWRFFVIISSTCFVVIVADLYFACGLVSGTNYSRSPVSA